MGFLRGNNRGKTLRGGERNMRTSLQCPFLCVDVAGFDVAEPEGM
jgi:hypothetical protein